MRLFCLRLGALVVLSAIAVPARADQDLIGPITWKPGDPPVFELFFSNHIHPNATHKVFQFVGEAKSVLDASPATFNIEIYFDYTDSSGQTVLIPIPPFGYDNVVPADGQIYHIEGGPYILPFCPEQVSIHFEIASDVEIVFQGLYDHTCVPEPNAVALFGLGGIALCYVWRRRRKK